jgi:hypothetical protein
MNREELEQVIYERTRDFVSRRVMDCILELIAEEREACAKVCETEGSVDDLPEHYADAIRSRGEVQP